MNKENVLSYLTSHKHEFHEKYGIIKIGLFGSYARNENNDLSDIDLAIEMNTEKKNIHTFFAFKRELESIFNRKVDVGIESSLKPVAKEELKKEIIYV